MIIRKIVPFLSVVIMTACSSVSEDPNTIHIDINKARKENFSEWFSGVDIIPLETNESSILYNCEKIVYEYQRFYIHDFRQYAIFVFDSLGNFLFSTLPLIGQGPGQFLSMTDFLISPITGNIEILDAFSQIIRVYDKDGKFIENKILSADLLPLGTFVQLTADLYLFCSADYEKKEKTTIKVFSVGKRKIVNNIVSLPENTKRLGVTDRIVFKRMNDNILFTFKFYNNDIYQIDTTASVIAHYQYDFGKYTLDLRSLLPDQEPSYYGSEFMERSKNNYILPLSKHENEKYRFCFFVFKEELYISRQNKETLQTDVIFNKFTGGGQVLPPLHLDEYYIYNKAEPSWLKEMLTEEMLSPEQQEIVSGINEFDNQIILRYKLK